MTTGVAIVQASRRRCVPAAACVAAVVAVTGFGFVAPRGHREAPLTIDAVQGGGPRGTRAIHSDDAVVFQRHLDASRDVRTGVDVLLWPEDVVDVDSDVVSTPEGQELAALAKAHRTTLVAGVVGGAEELHAEQHVRGRCGASCAADQLGAALDLLLVDGR